MDLKIFGAREFAFRKGFFKRAVVAETRRDVPLFREQRFVRRATRNVPADGHCAKSAAVIALPPRENAVAIFLVAFDVKLAREFYSGFRCFGTSRREINAATVAKIRRGHCEYATG